MARVRLRLLQDTSHEDACVTLTRRNFIILMAVKKDKDRRILALRGQRQSLEVQLTDLEARSQANAAKQHIKLLDEVRPESRVTASSPSPSACGVTAQRASEAPAGLRLDRRAALT